MRSSACEYDLCIIVNVKIVICYIEEVYEKTLVLLRKRALCSSRRSGGITCPLSPL